MVICKYFLQGNCRFGQYCKFEHTFGNNNRTKPNEDKNIALLVAQEILAAERGGQWLLSCYGPFKEKKCIPGMEDVSPEEVRWEMYQAQKNNTVDQVNAQFQQMCEQMKAKHEALKNPTTQVFQLLESIQNSGTENSGFGDKNKGSYAFGASQLSSNSQINTVFGQKTYGASNNLFGTTNAYSNQQSSSSIFGRTPTNTASVFGSKSNFGNASVFGTATQGNSIFGGANKSASTPFGATQNTQTFGGLSSQSQNTSLFGASTSNQSTFGQTTTFAASNNQSTSSFLKPQTSVFGSATPSGNVFGGSTSAPGSSIFGAASTTAVSNASTGSVFGQSTTAGTAFGGAPVFGGSTGFGTSPRPGGSIFGSQPVFGGPPGGTAATATMPNNVFGAANAGTSSFGSITQSATTNVFGSASSGTSANVFGNTAASVSSSFETTPNAIPFGAAISTATAPFGSAAQPGFATAASTASVFGSSAAVPFSQGSSFSASSNVFGSPTATTTTASAQSPFGANTFGGTQQQSNTTVFGVPICSPNVKSNPFVKSSPFGTASSSQSSPFGNFSSSGGAIGLSVSVTIDETGYSLENSLTDDEKAAYKMAQFLDGQIPLKPPTKELS